MADRTEGTKFPSNSRDDSGMRAAASDAYKPDEFANKIFRDVKDVAKEPENYVSRDNLKDDAKTLANMTGDQQNAVNAALKKLSTGAIGIEIVGRGEGVSIDALAKANKEERIVANRSAVVVEDRSGSKIEPMAHRSTEELKPETPWWVPKEK